MKQKQNYITPKGYQKLLDERDHLLKVERPKTVEVVSWAASLGDRSENADYQYGKKKLREIDKRVRFLNTRINDAIVVDPTQIESSKVQFGATVTIEDEDGETQRISIVGIDESDPKSGKLSWKSPIGSSLIGKGVGDEVIVKTPSGEKEFEVIELIYVSIN